MFTFPGVKVGSGVTLEPSVDDKVPQMVGAEAPVNIQNLVAQPQDVWCAEYHFVRCTNLFRDSSASNMASVVDAARRPNS